MGHRFEIGDFSCAVLDVGPSGPYKAHDLCLNVSPEEAERIVGATEIMSGLNALLVRTGDRTIVIDTGIGSLLPGGMDLLLGRLEAEGVSRDDVDLVLTSHGHADHIGGHSVDGEPTFPRARYFISKAEWDHFVVTGSGMEKFDKAAQMVLPPLESAGVIDWLEGGEIVPGLEVVELPGHTPGHTAFRMSGEGKSAIYIADSVFFPNVVQHPYLVAHVDWDGEGAVASRKGLLERAARDGALLVVYHFETPGLGRVEPDGDAWRWVPES